METYERLKRKLEKELEIAEDVVTQFPENAGAIALYQKRFSAYENFVSIAEAPNRIIEDSNAQLKDLSEKSRQDWEDDNTKIRGLPIEVIREIASSDNPVKALEKALASQL